MGTLFNASSTSGELFIFTRYSVSPIFAVPLGSVRFCALMALFTSRAESPLACNFAGFRSTITWRTLPPNGAGKVRQVMVEDRKSTRLNSSHGYISYAVFCLKKKKKQKEQYTLKA